MDKKFWYKVDQDIINYINKNTYTYIANIINPLNIYNIVSDEQININDYNINNIEYIISIYKTHRLIGHPYIMSNDDNIICIFKNKKFGHIELYNNKIIISNNIHHLINSHHEFPIYFYKCLNICGFLNLKLKKFLNPYCIHIFLKYYLNNINIKTINDINYPL